MLQRSWNEMTIHKLLVIGDHGGKMFESLYDRCSQNGWDPGKDGKRNNIFSVNVPRHVTRTMDLHTLKFVYVPEKMTKPRQSWSSVFRKVEMIIYTLTPPSIDTIALNHDDDDEILVELDLDEFKRLSNGEWFLETHILVVYSVRYGLKTTELLEILSEHTKSRYIDTFQFHENEDEGIDEVSQHILFKTLDRICQDGEIIENQPLCVKNTGERGNIFLKWISSIIDKSHSKNVYQSILQNSVSLPSTRFNRLNRVSHTSNRKSQSSIEIHRNDKDLDIE